MGATTDRGAVTAAAATGSGATARGATTGAGRSHGASAATTIVVYKLSIKQNPASVGSQVGQK